MVDGKDGYFRASAGMVVANGAGQVLAMRRKSMAAAAWQMPQGGIGFHEVPVEAAWRELREETGLTRGDVELVAESAQWLVYVLPVELRNDKVGWGQVQRWFLFRARPGVEVVPGADEFDAFAWFEPHDLVREAVAFRVPIYERVFAEFGLRIRFTPG